MLETINVQIGGKTYTYSKDISLQEIANEHQENYKYPILLARVNNKIHELTYTIQENADIEFIDLTSRVGNRCHISGLTYILVYAIKKLFGKKENIIVHHSLGKGLYVETTVKLTEAKLKQIKTTMKSIIQADMPFSKVVIDRIEAMKYFENNNDPTKAGVLNYNTNGYVKLYRLGNAYDYFYGYMAPSTGKIKDFDLTYLKENGFVLRYPTVYSSTKIPPYVHQQNMFEAYKEIRDLAKIMKVTNSVELNKIVTTGRVSDLIRIEESMKSSKLLNVAKDISLKKNVKIILVAGPSSSGKTTSSRKLCMYLQSYGINPKLISMDDYFVEKEETPLDENGEPDYECLEAVDIKLFDKQISQLLKGEQVTIPTYNFVHGKKEYKHQMKMEKHDVLVIEGIHALDTRVLTNIERKNKYKVYISALTELNLDDHNRICTSDNRLLRRIIRDNRTRGYSVDVTLDLWPSVRRGEEKYIFPYQDEADATINSALIYEIGVLKTYVEPLLYSVTPSSPYYEEAKRLINMLRLFLPIPADAIPQDSILREFIGGSCFHE